MASVADFKERFPEFSSIDDTRVQFFLDDTALIMASPVRWLDFYDVAQLYYAAHFITVSEATELGDTGVIAPIKHQEVDDVTIKSAIGDVEATFDELSGTSYGKRYIMYRRMVFAGVYGV
jgi:hypothetical protein